MSVEALLAQAPVFDRSLGHTFLILILGFLSIVWIAVYIRDPLLFRLHIGSNSGSPLGRAWNFLLSLGDALLILTTGNLVVWIKSEVVLLDWSLRNAIASTIFIQSGLLTAAVIFRGDLDSVWFLTLSFAFLFSFFLYWGVAQSEAFTRLKKGEPVGVVESDLSFGELVVFIVVTPLAFVAGAFVLDAQFHLFLLDGKPAAEQANWLLYFWYVGREYFKALPGFDLSEVYGWGHDKGLVSASIWGKHFTMLLRASYDLFVFGLARRFLDYVSLRNLLDERKGAAK